MTRHDLREVVLVEEDDLATGADDVVGRRGDVARRGRAPASWADEPADARPERRRLRVGRRPVAAFGVLTLLVAGAVVADGERERAQAARLDGVPGLLTPLGPDVTELWRRPAGWGQMATIGGDVVLGRLDAAGEDELVGLDAATGAEEWVAPIPELTERGEIWCETFGDADRHLTTHVACRIVDEREAFGRRVGARANEDVLLLVIDTATGDRVVERTLDTGYSTLESLGEDLVLVEVLDDAHVRVTRTDPATGEERWTFRSADPLPATGRLLETPVPVLQHDVLLVVGATGWALTPDGELLGEWDLRRTRLPALQGVAGAPTLAVLPDGRYAVAGPVTVGERPESFGTVSATDADDGFAIPGPVLEPSVDDGSADGVVLTARTTTGELAAQDPSTGERVWSSPDGVRGDALVLDGRVVAVTDDAVTALDARSGDLLWTVPLEGRRSPRLLTDGHVVMGGLRGPGDERVLVAWGAEDGRERWRAPLPRDAEVLRAIGSRLFAFGDDDVIALGRPGSAGGARDEGDRGDRGDLGDAEGDPAALAGSTTGPRLP